MQKVLKILNKNLFTTRHSKPLHVESMNTSRSTNLFKCLHHDFSTNDIDPPPPPPLRRRKRHQRKQLWKQFSIEITSNKDQSKASEKIILLTCGLMHCVTKRNCLWSDIWNIAYIEIVWPQEWKLALQRFTWMRKFNETRVPNFIFNTKTTELNGSFY